MYNAPNRDDRGDEMTMRRRTTAQSLLPHPTRTMTSHRSTWSMKRTNASTANPDDLKVHGKNIIAATKRTKAAADRSQAQLKETSKAVNNGVGGYSRR